MKERKNYIALTMIIVMLTQVIPCTFVEGSGTFSYESQAQTLNDLGLYNGISDTAFDPDLATVLNRETGVIMLLRIFGLEADALALTDAETDAILAKFTDASSIASWAKRQVAYAVKNGLVKGTSDTTFEPASALKGKAYATLILRQLGYTPNYDTAAAELAQAGGLTPAQASLFSGKSLIKDDLVGISFGSLSAINSGGKIVIQQLIGKGVVSGGAAADAGLILGTPPQPISAPTPPPPTQTPAPAPANSNHDDDDDDDDIIGTGVISSLTIEQGSAGVKEVNKLTILNGASAAGKLLFSMSDGNETNVIKLEVWIEVPGDNTTVANAVYSEVADFLVNYDVSIGDIGDTIIFTNKIVEADKTVSIALEEDTTPEPTGVGSVIGVQDKAGVEPVTERYEILITNGAVRKGTLRLTVNQAFVNVPVQAGNAEDVVAEKLIQGLFNAINNDPNFSFMSGVYSVDSDGALIIIEGISPDNIVDLVITLE